MGKYLLLVSNIDLKVDLLMFFSSTLYNRVYVNILLSIRYHDKLTLCLRIAGHAVDVPRL